MCRVSDAPPFGRIVFGTFAKHQGLSQKIQAYGLCTYIYHKNHPNVSKYTIPMDPINNISMSKYILGYNIQGNPNNNIMAGQPTPLKEPPPGIKALLRVR